MTKIFDENGNEVTREQVANELHDETRAHALLQRERTLEYRDSYAKSRCEAAGIDSSDKRLDLSSPEAFEKSLLKVVREDAAKGGQENEEEEGKQAKESRARSARDDLGVLSSPRGGAAERKPKATLDDADDIGDTVSKLFASGWKRGAS